MYKMQSLLQLRLNDKAEGGGSGKKTKSLGESCRAAEKRTAVLDLNPETEEELHYHAV